MSDEEIVNAAETTRIDLRALSDRPLAFKATGIKKRIPGPPPNEATTCVVLELKSLWLPDEIERGDMIVSEDHYMFWRAVRAKLRVGYWIIGRIVQGHTATILDPATADEMEMARVTIAAYNEHHAQEAGE